MDDRLFGDDQDNRIEGGRGRDKIWGGLGDDTLVGGTEDNELWGGEGDDVFVTQSGGRQIIKDFERGIDKIDMAGVGVNQIAFAFDSDSDPGSTIIKVDGTERVRVVGSMVDSSSLINTTQDINPQTLTPEEINNLSRMLQRWAESYAQSLGLSTNNVSVVDLKDKNDEDKKSLVQMVGGDLKFIDYGTENTETSQGLQIENMTRNSSMLFKNNSTESSSITFTYSDGKGYEISNQDTTEWTKGHEVGVGLEVNFKAGIPIIAQNETTVKADYRHSWSNGQSKTTIITDNVNTQQGTSITFNPTLVVTSREAG